ncbi:MAG: OmpL47-type beta-barrel domain-containing protein [Thermoplasmatota archaeon]
MTIAFLTMAAGGALATTGPSAALSATPNLVQTGQTVTFYVTGSDPGKSFSMELSFGDGSPDNSAPASTVTHTFAASGTFVATLTVTGSDGKFATATTSVKVDGTAPTTAIAYSPARPASGWWNSGVTVSLTASDPDSASTIYYSVDGAAFKAYGGAISISSDGYHSVAYYAVDPAGNTAATKTASIDIDTVAPNVTPTDQFPSEGQVVSGSIVVGATGYDAGSGMALLSISEDGSPVPGCVGSTSASCTIDTTTAADGPHTLTVYGIDNAGNVGSHEVQFVVANGIATASVGFDNQDPGGQTPLGSTTGPEGGTTGGVAINAAQGSAGLTSTPNPFDGARGVLVGGAYLSNVALCTTQTPGPCGSLSFFGSVSAEGKSCQFDISYPASPQLCVTP